MRREGLFVAAASKACVWLPRARQRRCLRRRLWPRRPRASRARHSSPAHTATLVFCACGRRIKLWAGERCVRTYTGHADAVRSLAHVSGIGFLSASNDGTVRLWELGGTCLHVQHASESFVYSVAVLPTGEWMTSSEDRTVKIWPSGGGECVQSMTHPANVWACAALPNGDIVAGCADGNAYVWTRAPARAAAEAEQLAFKETVASVALPAQQVASDLGALEKDIKGEDALNTPGTREGQTLIVRDPASKTPMLYQWSMASATWEKVRASPPARTPPAPRRPRREGVVGRMRTTRHLAHGVADTAEAAACAISHTHARRRRASGAAGGRGGRRQGRRRLGRDAGQADV
jgi:WD40 repeat protein